MIRFSTITVVLLNGTAVAFQNASFLEVANACLSYPLVNQDPVLVTVGEDYNVYVNIGIFKAWVEKEISITELTDQLKVDFLARNTETIIANNIEIEDDCLWMVKDNLCTLVGDDEHVTQILDERFVVFK